MSTCGVGWCVAPAWQSLHCSGALLYVASVTCFRCSPPLATKTFGTGLGLVLTLGGAAWNLESAPVAAVRVSVSSPWQAVQLAPSPLLCLWHPPQLVV